MYFLLRTVRAYDRCLLVLLRSPRRSAVTVLMEIYPTIGSRTHQEECEAVSAHNGYRLAYTSSSRGKKLDLPLPADLAALQASEE